MNHIHTFPQNRRKFIWCRVSFCYGKYYRIIYIFAGVPVAEKSSEILIILLSQIQVRNMMTHPSFDNRESSLLSLNWQYNSVVPIQFLLE